MSRLKGCFRNLQTNIYELKDKNNMQYNTFNYANPIAFAKENVVYILSLIHISEPTRH